MSHEWCHLVADYAWVHCWAAALLLAGPPATPVPPPPLAPMVLQLLNRMDAWCINGQDDIDRLQTLNWVRRIRCGHGVGLRMIAEAQPTLRLLSLDAVIGPSSSLVSAATEFTASAFASLRHLRLGFVGYADDGVVLRTVAEALPRLRRLHLEQAAVVSLGCFSRSTYLEEVTLSDGSSVEDISGLEGAASLRVLRLQHCGFASVSHLGRSPSLTSIELNGCVALADIAGLECLATLRYLWLCDCPLLRDVGVLRGSKSLDTLGLACCPAITADGILGLELIPTLTTVTLRDLPALHSLADLASSRHLVSLDVVQVPLDTAAFISFFNIICNAATLRHLSLVRCGVASVSRIASSPSLISLSIDAFSLVTPWPAVPFASDGLRGLEGLRSLTELELRSCFDVTSLGHLGACTSLRVLRVHTASIADAGLKGLEGAAELRELVLEGCGFITDAGVEHLSRIATLTSLSLCDCPLVVDVSCLARCCRGLERLNLTRTGVVGAGLRGLEGLRSLTHVTLDGCTDLLDVCALGSSASLAYLSLSKSHVTNEGIEGLERIPTLTHLDLSGCLGLTRADGLLRCPALLVLNVASTHLVDPFWSIATLQTLCEN